MLLIQVVSKTKNAADVSPMPKEEWPKLDVRTDFTHFPAKLVRLAFHDCLKSPVAGVKSSKKKIHHENGHQGVL